MFIQSTSCLSLSTCHLSLQAIKVLILCEQVCKHCDVWHNKGLFLLSVCSLKIFQGNRHEVLHDKDQERARKLINDWILARLRGPTACTESSSPPLEPPKEEEEGKDVQTPDDPEGTHQEESPKKEEVEEHEGEEKDSAHNDEAESEP